MRNGEYELVVAPDDFPGKKYRGRYCYEHHLAYWMEHGVVPGADECIHHLDEDKRNNDPENLELVKKGHHSKIHHKEREMMSMICAYCGSEFTKEARQLKCKVMSGQKDFYCNRSCAARHFGRGRPKLVSVPG